MCAVIGGTEVGLLQSYGLPQGAVTPICTIVTAASAVNGHNVLGKIVSAWERGGMGTRPAAEAS